jgi:hypothetical protein
MSPPHEGSSLFEEDREWIETASPHSDTSRDR